ncbi:MAG TPA: hypothetical protein VKB45_03690, partial [Gemmatimonadales bacterium]|nr:hypothetical protein [Gemmatimonadales bacterium]
MDELKALRSLATELGVHTRYTDGLGKKVTVGPETLIRVCAALGAPVTAAVDAGKALHDFKSSRRHGLPPVIVAWNGELRLPPFPTGRGGHTGEGAGGQVQTEGGELLPLENRTLPIGYHRLVIGSATSTIIAAPLEAWRRPGSHRSWGVGTQLAALRSRRSRSVGDLKDLESLCRWLRE